MSMLGRESPDARDEKLGGSRSGPAVKEENIYIPQFITKRPFYAIDESEEDAAAAAAAAGVRGASGEAGNNVITEAGATTVVARDYLEHQRLRKKEEKSGWYQRGKTAGPAATKYRKGACENCGSMGHKRADCLSRPRAKLAKYTGKDIQADEVVQDVHLSWEAKRDRWAGFDARQYSAIVARREKANEAKRQLLKSAGIKGENDNDEDEDEDDPAKEDTRYAEDADMGVSRNNGAADLRMREDTARYLVNLDLDSAQYDPKRRKMTSGGAYLDESARLFAEEDFAKASGDAAAFERDERYAWEVHDKTGDASMHLQANPTAAAHRRKKEAEEAEAKRKEMAALMKEKYGIVELDEETSEKTKAKALAATAASETFVEYDEAGHVKEKLRGKRSDRSKYAEDVFPGNHSSVWGSWWNNFQWGYACCHSFVRNSYCTGEDGKAAWERAERQRLGDWDEADQPSERKQLTEGNDEVHGDDGDDAETKKRKRDKAKE